MHLKIAVLRALKLGDMLCSMPALHALREEFPSAEITLICHPSQLPLLKRYEKTFDVLLPFAGFPGMPEQNFNAEDSLRFISDIQQRNFDIVFQMQGSGEISNLLVSLFGAKTMYGFYREGNYCPDPKTFALYPEDLSEVDRCLSLVSLVKKSRSERHTDFPLSKKDFQDLFNLMGRPSKPYICIHPGASTETKRWSKKGFAVVADHLRHNGYHVIFTGSSMESELVREISAMMSEEAIDSASLDLPLGPLSALIAQSEGLICNDTGVSHLASHLRVPSIVIFSETDPKRWSPLDKGLHRSIVRPSIEELIFETDTFFLKSDLGLNKLELQ